MSKQLLSFENKGEDCFGSVRHIACYGSAWVSPC